MSFSIPLPCHAEEEASVIEWIEANADQFIPRRPNGSPLRKRTKSTKIDYWSTGWSRMLRNPALDNLSLSKPSNSSFGFVSPTLCSYFISYQCALKKKSSLASLLGYIPSRQSSNFSYPFGYLVVATAPMISLSFLTVGTQPFQRFAKICWHISKPLYVFLD